MGARVNPSGRIDRTGAAPMVGRDAVAKGTSMTASKDQVLAALAKIPTPSGAVLTQSKVLSEIVVSDGKVFFSITVNAADVKS